MNFFRGGSMKAKKFIELVHIELLQIFRIPDIYVIAGALPLITLIILNALSDGTKGTQIVHSFGGIMSIGIIGAGVMGLSSIVTDYRHNGVLRQFSVTPVKPLYLVVSICIGLSVLAIVSSSLVILEYYFLFNIKISSNILVFILVYCFSLVSIFSIGMIISSFAANQNIANIITILFYFPSLLVSGTTIPYQQLPFGVKVFSRILPTTHSVFLLQAVAIGDDLADFKFSFLYLTIVIIIGIFATRKYFKWK